MPAAIDMQAFERVMRRLRSNPKQFLESARRGAAPECTALGNFWTQMPELISMGVLDVFYHHLSESKAPSDVNPRPAESIANLAFISLAGLTKVGPFWADDSISTGPVIKAWPGIFKWSRYFFLVRVLPPDVNEEVRRSSLDALCASWYALGHHDEVRKAMVETPGAIELAAQMWVREDAGPLPTFVSIPAGSACFGSMLKFADETALDRVLKATGGKADEVAQLALSRLRSSIKGRVLDGTRLVIFVDTINSLCRQRDHRLRDAFLSANAIWWVTKTLVVISNQKNIAGDEKMLGAMETCFGFLTNYIESTDGFTWVSQAIQGGLLAAFIDCSPAFSAFDTNDLDDIIMPIITDILPRYLVFRSVLRALDGVMVKIDQSQQANKINDSVAKEAWQKFKRLATERRMVLLQHQTVKDKCITCDNVKCQKVDDKNNFQKCSACLSTFYCSKECQALAWKEGDHKTMCKLKQRERLEGKTEKISKRDYQFLHHLCIRDASHHLPHLRSLAARDFPDTPLTGLTIIINYTVLPATFNVQPLEGYKGFPTAGSVIAEARYDALIEKVKVNQGQYAYIEALFSYGEGQQVITTLVKGSLWKRDGDGMVQEDYVDDEWDDDGVDVTTIDDVDRAIAHMSIQQLMTSMRHRRGDADGNNIAF